MGELAKWVAIGITASGMIYQAGKTSERIDTLATALTEVKVDLKEHMKESREFQDKQPKEVIFRGDDGTWRNRKGAQR